MPTPAMPQELIDEAHEMVRRCNGNQSAAAERLGVPRSTLRRRLEGGRSQHRTEASPKLGRSLQEFHQEYDRDLIIPKKLREALAELGEGWEYETQFARAAGVSMHDIATYREQFADYVVYIRKSSKRAWAGTPEIAAHMRSIAS